MNYKMLNKMAEYMIQIYYFAFDIHVWMRTLYIFVVLLIMLGLWVRAD